VDAIIQSDSPLPMGTNIAGSIATAGTPPP
jgi:hypothetical protein